MAEPVSLVLHYIIGFTTVIINNGMLSVPFLSLNPPKTTGPIVHYRLKLYTALGHSWQKYLLLELGIGSFFLFGKLIMKVHPHPTFQ